MELVGRNALSVQNAPITWTHTAITEIDVLFYPCSTARERDNGRAAAHNGPRCGAQRTRQCFLDDGPAAPIQRPRVLFARFDSSSASSVGIRVQPSPDFAPESPSFRLSRFACTSFSRSSREALLFSALSCEYRIMPSKDVSRCDADSCHVPKVSIM